MRVLAGDIAPQHICWLTKLQKSLLLQHQVYPVSSIFSITAGSTSQASRLSSSLRPLQRAWMKQWFVLSQPRRMSRCVIMPPTWCSVRYLAIKSATCLALPFAAILGGACTCCGECIEVTSLLQEWMLDFRLKAYRKWLTMAEPAWSDNRCCCFPSARTEHRFAQRVKAGLSLKAYYRDLLMTGFLRMQVSGH